MQVTGTLAIPHGCDVGMGLLQVTDEHLAALTVLTQLTRLRLVRSGCLYERERPSVEISPAGEAAPLQQ